MYPKKGLYIILLWEEGDEGLEVVVSNINKKIKGKRNHDKNEMVGIQGTKSIFHKLELYLSRCFP
jgi:hypothetical protein